MYQCRDAQRHQHDADTDARSHIHLDQPAQQMQAKQKDQRSRNWGEQRTILIQEAANRAGRCAQSDEHHGEPDDERDRRREQIGFGLFTLAKLFHPDPRKHRDVPGHKWKHTRREERDEPRKKSSCEGDIRHDVSLPS